MRACHIWLLLGAAACPVIADGRLQPVHEIRHARYDLRTGTISEPSGPAQRNNVVVWSSTVTVGLFSSYTSSELVLDWGDLVPQAAINEFQLAYATDSSAPITIDVIFYDNENGFDSFGRTPVTSFRLRNLPGGTGGLGFYTGWLFTVDLSGGFEFPLGGADLDGDSLADFGYSYAFHGTGDGSGGVQQLHGPFITTHDPNIVPPNVGPGAENAFDLFSEPNTGLEPNELKVPGFNVLFDGTFWFGGDPFAQFYMQLCADANTPANCCVGDISPPAGDGLVNLPDLAQLLAAFGSTGPPGIIGDIYPCPCIGDGIVDLFDLATLLSAFGLSCPTPCSDCGTTPGTATLSVDLLTSAEEPNLPAGMLLVDVAVFGNPGDASSISAILGTADGGAGMTYVLDPNTGQPLITGIEASTYAERFVTFVSRPSPQHAAARFSASSAAFMIGGFTPPGPGPVADPLVLNVVWANLPREPGLLFGYTIRVALDISATGLSNTGAYLSTTGPAAPTDIRVFSGTMVAYTYLVPCPTPAQWEVYLPYFDEKKCNCREVWGG